MTHLNPTTLIHMFRPPPSPLDTGLAIPEISFLFTSYLLCVFEMNDIPGCNFIDGLAFLHDVDQVADQDFRTRIRVYTQVESDPGVFSHYFTVMLRKCCCI
jgi:hypothetical protein